MDEPTVPSWQTRPAFRLQRLAQPMKKGGLQAEVDYAEHYRRYPTDTKLKRKYTIKGN